MRKYNIYVGYLYSFDNRNAVEYISLLFEGNDVLALGIQMMY